MLGIGVLVPCNGFIAHQPSSQHPHQVAGLRRNRKWLLEWPTGDALPEEHQLIYNRLTHPPALPQLLFSAPGTSTCTSKSSPQESEIQKSSLRKRQTETDRERESKENIQNYPEPQRERERKREQREHSELSRVWKIYNILSWINHL